MNTLFFAAIFGLSFTTYTLLRQLDERSTAKLNEKIDLQKHEINPTITWLAARVGLKKAFTITWLVIAFTVATADAFIGQTFPYGVPIFALIIGFGHVLAWANNTHVSYVVDKLGVEQFEREHEERMAELAALSWPRRLLAVFHANPASLIMLVAALPLVSVLGYAMIATEVFTLKTTTDIFLILPLNVAFCFLIATVVIQPAFALGPLILASRYARNLKGKGSPNVSTDPSNMHFDVPLAVVAQALDAAHAEGGSVVRISIPMITKEVNP